MIIKNKQNKNTLIYVFTIITISILIIIYFGINNKIDFSTILFWILISTIAESLIIVLPNNIGVSVGLAVSIAAIIVIGPYQAALCSALGITFRVIKIGKGKIKHLLNTEYYKTLFNAAQIFISTFVSGSIYLLMIGNEEIVYIPQAIVLIFIHTVINCSIMSILSSLILEKKVFSILYKSFIEVILNTALVGFLGIIMALVSNKIGNSAILLFFGPLLIARYSFRQYKDMRDTYMETINAFNKALEAKDPYTSGHSVRVQEYSERLADALGLTYKKMMDIKTAAILHDIGKIGIDDFILRKPGKLTEEEFAMIKKHPEIGSDILKDVDFLARTAKIIRSHHERYDGKGYPDGIKGDEIPIESAILSIADVFDAMTSDRPYRKALTKEEALEEIKRNSGIQFSPKIADKFCEIISEE